MKVEDITNYGKGFISCHADDVVFPHIGPKLGFVYTRSRTLGYGAPCCDFRFKKV